GIRDFHVTGVQTCALPIYMVIPASGAKAGTVTAYQFYNAVMHSHARTTYTNIWAALQQPGGPAAHAMRSVMPQVQHLYELFQLRSEERRVGKERRSVLLPL